MSATGPADGALDSIVAFLRGIGIPVSEGVVPPGSFLPGIRVSRGMLVFDRGTYGLGVYPGSSGLARAGMTLVGADAVAAGIRPYPAMTRWLRE